MTIRKITIDNSVRYVKKNEQTEEQIKSISRGGKSNTRKKNSLPHKQNKKVSEGGNTRKNISVPRKRNEKISQNNKKFSKNIITGEGFRKLE